MKVFRILGRNVRDSFKSVFRNFSLSLASISCITITLIVMSLAIILTYNVNNFVKLVEQDVTIVAFLKSNITIDEADEVKDAINSLDYIDQVTYQSKEDVTKTIKNSSETFNNIMSSWSIDDNPLQPTFQVKVTDIDQVGKIASHIKKINNVEIVKYGEGMIEQLIAVFDSVRKVMVGIVIALIIVTAFLISNTIKITIFSRKREIEIMRLVGASNINIKVPFILEGLFLGILGSIIPIIVSIYGYNALYSNFKGQILSPFIKLIEPQPFIYIICLTLLIIGILVGMFGSWRAVRKHLKA
ncbi:MAG: permease-like cell division protein FtsX [Bacilli bacterium]